MNVYSSFVFCVLLSGVQWGVVGKVFKCVHESQRRRLSSPKTGCRSTVCRDPPACTTVSSVSFNLNIAMQSMSGFFREDRDMNYISSCLEISNFLIYIITNKSTTSTCGGSGCIVDRATYDTNEVRTIYNGLRRGKILLLYLTLFIESYVWFVILHSCWIKTTQCWMSGLASSI